MGEHVWLTRLLEKLNILFSRPISVFCNSQSTLHIARNPIFMNELSILKVLSLCAGYSATRPYPFTS